MVRGLRLCLLLRAARSTSRRSACAASGGPSVTFVIALLIMVDLVPAQPPRRLRSPMGESMFVDLRDRISKQGRPPRPAARVARRVGGAVGGRHVVRRRLHRGAGAPATTVLELVVVDVSGKGVEAGSRVAASSPVPSTASSPRSRATIPPGGQRVPAGPELG